LILLRFGAVLNLLKEYWEWAVTGVVVLFAFLLGRRGKVGSDKRTELKQKESDILETASEKELAGTTAAGEKHVEEILNTHAEAFEKLKQAEDDRDRLLQELVDNPSAIDRKLKELGIKEV